MSALVARSARLSAVHTQKCYISNSASTKRALAFSLDNLHSDSSRGQKLRMIMFGKPGAGKGTLSSRLVSKYDIMSLSTGDLLRQHITERTEVGQQAEEIVAKGGLLPDDIMLKVVTSKLDSLHNKHWILDGFPRTLGQARLLDAHLQKQETPLNLVVNLDVPDEVILSRISDRWVHLPSGRVYNLSSNKPKVDGLDDITGEPLTKRPDDNPEIFSRRLAKFYETTSPLLSYYDSVSSTGLFAPPVGKDGLQLATVKGTTSDEIWPKLEAVILSTFPNLKERAEVRKRHSLADALAVQEERGPLSPHKILRMGIDVL